MSQQSQTYSSQFYRAHAVGSADSASVVVPLVLTLVPVKSVIDVGCGVGTWAASFLANGVSDVSAVDGDYVDRSLLRIPADLFIVHDLTQPLKLDRKFDLAVCLEVAEHLPQSRASSLVGDLTSLAPCVLFSAAVPGAGGTHHINEQYLPYWIDLFQRHGFEGIDPIRPWILGNHSVEWWYQQNIVLFVAADHPILAKNFPKAQSIIHEHLYDRTRNYQPTLRMLFRAFPVAVFRAIRYHLGILRGKPL